MSETPTFWARHVCSWYGRGAVVAVVFAGNLWQQSLFAELDWRHVLAAAALAFGCLVVLSWLARALLGLAPLVPVGRIRLGSRSCPGELPLMLIPLAAAVWVANAAVGGALLG